MDSSGFTYETLLESKIVKPIKSGFKVDKLNPLLFPFQDFIVCKALEAGRYAIFADCGLGKTLMQLEWAHQVSVHTAQPVLILAPLAVSGQTIKEGRKFGIEVTKLLPEMYAIDELPTGIYITNYEQLENILNIEQFAGIVLDESSILKNFTGVYKNLIIERFKDTPYRLACTATPAPNDLNEIGNHSEFLGVLDAQDMRSKWFVRDEGMNNYRLKGHAKKDFYAWISSWACMITNPADLGFDGSAYVLPELNFVEKILQTENRSNGKLFNDVHVSATNYNQELRLTQAERLAQVADIVNGSTEQFIVWVKHNEEADILRKLIPDAVEVRGSDSPELKEKRLLGFAEGAFRVLITKTKIAQFGLNFQNCHNMIFASPDFSFEGMYQAIRRCFRFGQKHIVNVWVIITDTMQNVINKFRRAQSQFLEMQQEMNKNINAQQYGLVNTYEFREYRDERMWLMKGDSCIEIKRVPDNSVDLIIFSPPFSSLFTYSNYIHDMGNNASHADFFRQYAFLLKELYRVLKPGRLMCCHTKDLGVYKNSSGYTGMYDFTAEHTRAVLNTFDNALSCSWDLRWLKQKERDILYFLEEEKDADIKRLQVLTSELIETRTAIDRLKQVSAIPPEKGFKLHSKITIWTDPVLEMQRTKTQRLLYKTVTSDSSYTGIGMAEYVTIFRKWDGNEDQWEPVTNLNRGNFPLDVWQRWASPVWMDIKRTDVLNGHEGTDQGDEKHIAPLQLDVIRRLVHLWSNYDDTVLTSFLGIGSEAYVALQEGRKAIGIELKDSYFDVAVRNCRNAQLQKTQLSLI